MNEVQTKEQPGDAAAPNPAPGLTIVIPAHNEEQALPLCLRSIEEARPLFPGTLEIVVVLNRCSDATEEIALHAGCRIVRCDIKNLSVIRNAGVRASRAPLVATIDADSRMSRGMLAHIAETMKDPRTIGGGVLILPERYSLGILASALMLLPIALYHGIGGGLFFFRRESFEAIGGFDERRLSAEDIDFIVRLKRHARSQGKRIRTLLRSYIVTSCRKFDHFGDWYFVTHPLMTWRLLRGTDAEAANRVWYDFFRTK